MAKKKDALIRSRVSPAFKQRLERFIERDAKERNESALIREAVADYLTKEERELGLIPTPSVDETLLKEGLEEAKKKKQKPGGGGPSGKGSLPMHAARKR